MINWFQKFWSQDDRSRYTHAAIIVSPEGKVMEAIGKGIGYGNLFSYSKHPVLIARHRRMNQKRFDYGMAHVNRHLGHDYPFHRLLFHIFPPLSKRGFGMAVCSELVAEFLYSLNFLPYWQGVNPDELADIFRHWKDFDIIFEGILPEKGA